MNDKTKIEKAIYEYKKTHTLIDIETIKPCVDVAIDYLSGRLAEVASEDEVASIIHRTREWQALHLEVVADILENVKKGLAHALVGKIGQREMGREKVYREALEAISITMAQPKDRISVITPESYEKIRVFVQKVVSDALLQAKGQDV